MKIWISSQQSLIWIFRNNLDIDFCSLFSCRPNVGFKIVYYVAHMLSECVGLRSRWRWVGRSEKSNRKCGLYGSNCSQFSFRFSVLLLLSYSFFVPVNNFTIFVFTHSLTLSCTQYITNGLWEIFPSIFLTTHALVHSLYVSTPFSLISVRPDSIDWKPTKSIHCFRRVSHVNDLGS